MVVAAVGQAHRGKDIEGFVPIIAAGAGVGPVVPPLAVGCVCGAIGPQAFVFFEPYVNNAGIAFRFVTRAGVGDDLNAVDLLGG